MTKVFRVTMEPNATPRSCGICGEPAAYAVYLSDQRGAMDKSSRKFVCATHGERKAA